MLNLLCRKIVRTFQYYDLNGEKCFQSLRILSATLNKFDCQGTVFIPSLIFEKYFEKISGFSNIEWSAHGKIHIDYTKTTDAYKATDVKIIKETFHNLGIKNIGFRAPYGKISTNMLKFLAKEGFYYDSSYVKLFEDMLPIKSLNESVTERVKKIYSVTDKYYFSDNGIIEVPFSVPDDEILMDMCNLSPKIIEKIWCKMLKKVISDSGIFVLQLHPARVRYLASSLTELLQVARREKVSILSLSEAVEKIKKGKIEPILCVTGDIDAVKLSEYLHHTTQRFLGSQK